MELNLFMIKPIVEQALKEDIGYYDLTTVSIIPEKMRAKAVIKVKQQGILAGMPVVKLVYQLLDPTVTVNLLQGEGAEVSAGMTVAEVSGPARSILTGERVALNFLQRLSGIATKTRAMADSLQYFNCHITDTRKTTPGLRILEKYAVRIGGGRNHRFDLADSVLIKDNHIEVSGGIKNAVSKARRSIGHTIKIEVETTSLEQVTDALEAGVDIIMLDNMPLEMMSEAVSLIGDKALIEASGNIDETTIVEVARTGVHYISSGSLTHSYKSLDISMDISYGDK